MFLFEATGAHRVCGDFRRYALFDYVSYGSFRKSPGSRRNDSNEIGKAGKKKARSVSDQPVERLTARRPSPCAYV